MSCMLFIYTYKGEFLLLGYIIIHFALTFYFYQKYLYFDLISNKLEQSLIIPIKSKYSEIINGLSTIRAYRKIDFLLQSCFRKLKLYGKASQLRT